ncbi:MAG: hypothetical protein ACOY3D_05540 [Candidatus Omnitrophota bacterium]
MNKFLYFLTLICVFCGCATNARFVEYRNYDVGRSVNLSYAVPPDPVIVPYNQTQDKYIIDWGNGCKFAYYVNKETKIVESWEYLCSPDKCKTGIGWFSPNW